jgi:hypothetical protein
MRATRASPDDILPRRQISETETAVLPGHASGLALAPPYELISPKVFIFGSDLIDLNHHIVNRIVRVVNDSALDSLNCVPGILNGLICCVR